MQTIHEPAPTIKSTNLSLSAEARTFLTLLVRHAGSTNTKMVEGLILQAFKRSGIRVSPEELEGMIQETRRTFAKPQ